MKEEQGLLLIQQKKNYGYSRDWTPAFEVKHQHLIATKPRGLVHIEGIILPFGWTCYLWVLTELASLQTSRANVFKVCKPYLWTWCHQALVFSSTVAPRRHCLSHWM
jgi:hypothetical protein